MAPADGSTKGVRVLVLEAGGFLRSRRCWFARHPVCSNALSPAPLPFVRMGRHQAARKPFKTRLCEVPRPDNKDIMRDGPEHYTVNLPGNPNAGLPCNTRGAIEFPGLPD